MLLVKGGTLLTFNQENQVIEGGGVLLDGEEILAVGDGEDLKSTYPEARVLDARGRIIMPGLINTHHHLYSTFARGMDLKTSKPPFFFEEILEKLWWRLDANLTREEDLYYSALYGIVEGIEYGTTTLFDHHASYGLIEGSLGILKEVVEETGIRANLCFEVSDRHGKEKGRRALQENVRFLESLVPEERSYLGGMMGLHASFTLEDETLDIAGQEAERLGVPSHIHVGEGLVDIEDSLKRGYMGVVARLQHFHILQPNTLAIHGVNLKEEEFKELAKSCSYLIYNPQSNMANGVGTFNLLYAMKEGLSIGLGTDGFTNDMFESLKVANLLTTHYSRVPGRGVVLSKEMLFTTNCQLAESFFGLPLGSLAPGYGADVIIVDYSSPTPILSANAFQHLLMGVSGARVRTTIARGRILMEDREWKVLDVERVKAKAREQAANFWSRF